jgi:hypothetical protein
VEETLKVEAAVIPPTQAPAQVEETPAEAEATPAAAAEEAPKDDTQPAEAEKKTPKLLARILAPFKGDGKKAEKKEKSPKSPKKKKKGETEAAATSGEESSKEETEPPKEAKEVEPAPVKEPETPAPVAETSTAHDEAKKEEKKDEKKDTNAKATKLGRRISARVGDFFKVKPKTEVASAAKVDEHPPKIDQPAPVAPLENVTEAAGEASAAETETAKPVEPAPAVTPVVAAAA